MSEIYRKRGAVVRWENGMLVHVVESGEAVEDASIFRCAPSKQPPLPHLDPARVVATAAAIEASLLPGVTIERLLISEGVAEHELGDKQWSDRSERVHLSLTRGRLRVLLDLGSFALDDVGQAIRVLARAEEPERAAPVALTLAPIVAAALLPALTGVVPKGLELWQSGGGLDGRGQPIEEMRIDGTAPPNWYRPSYRMRPVRLPLNLRARGSEVLRASDQPRAVALLAPVHGPQVQVLIDDAGSVYPARIAVTAVRGVAAEAVWYPYGAGSFGAEMVL